jgi:hypothetical protein
MAIGRISGQMLKANLLRSGTDLAFETNLLVLDVTNSFVGVGTATPSRQLHISGTGALRLPSGTDAQRGTAANGDIRYNTDQTQIEGYVDGAWVDLGSGSKITDADGNTGIDVERATDQNEIHFFIESVGDVAHIRSDGAIELNNLEIDNQTITGLTTNGDINITPNGTGNVNLNADTIRVGDSSGDITITTNDAVDLILSTNNGTNSGTIKIQDNANGNIEILPNGAGEVVVTSAITTNGTNDLVLDTNAGTNSGSITIFDGVDGNIDITPNGTGEVNITKVDIGGGEIDGTTIGANSAAAGTFTNLTANGTINIDGDGTGDNIDGVIIGANLAAAGTFTTVDTSGNVTVGGNLIVNGVTTTIESTTLQIEDPLIVLAKNNSGGTANTYDQGLLINRGSETNQAFIWDESADEFAVVSTTETGGTAGNIVISAYADFTAKDLNGDKFITTGITIEDNNITATQSNDNLVLTPSGTGSVVINGSATFNGTVFFGDNNIGDVGDINVDSVSSDNGTDFDLLLDDNQSAALEIKEGSTAYMTFVTTNSSEQITVDKKLLVSSGVTFESNTVDINGGAIDGTAIGANSRSTGQFTSIDANAGIDIDADNQSLTIGASADFTIAHDGTDTTIDNNTGILKILGAASSSIQINSDAANVDTQISGDSDAELIYVDASADRIGISTASPAYILDIASTDAVRLPSGANGTRPTAATGVIRFNTDSSAYEGSTDGSTWTTFAMGGGGVAAISKVSATGDGSTSTFTGFFADAPATAANVMVYIDNVYQEPTENYTVSSNNITFTSAPHSGARIFALVGFDAGSMTTGGVARTQTDTVAFTSSATAIMTYNATSYRSAELFITITDAGNTEYSCMKANVVHDGTTAYISVYGIVNTGSSDTATITASLAGNTVTVSAVSTGGASSALVQYSLQAV